MPSWTGLDEDEADGDVAAPVPPGPGLGCDKADEDMTVPVSLGTGKVDTSWHQFPPELVSVAAEA